MARVIRKVYTPMVAAPAAICASQTPAAGKLLINGTLVTSVLWESNAPMVPSTRYNTNDLTINNVGPVLKLTPVASTTGTYKPNEVTVSPLGQKVSITVTADESAKTFIVTGIDWLGNKLIETIIGPASGTAIGVMNFYRVVSVSISALAAGAITVGFSGSLDCPWIPVDRYVPTGQFSFWVAPSGASTFKVESTLDNAQDGVPNLVNSTILASGSVAGGQPNLSQVMSAMRVSISAYTSGNIVFSMNYLTSN